MSFSRQRVEGRYKYSYVYHSVTPVCTLACMQALKSLTATCQKLQQMEKEHAAKNVAAEQQVGISLMVGEGEGDSGGW